MTAGELYWLRQIDSHGHLMTVTEPPGAISACGVNLDAHRDLDAITRKGLICRDVDPERYRLTPKGEEALRATEFRP